MSTLLAPLPDHDPLTLSEVAAALGMTQRAVQWTLRTNPGRFPGAFRTPALGGHGHWRIPRATAEAIGKELGVWDK